MKNNYSPKQMLLSAAVLFGTFCSSYAQAPLSNSPAVLNNKFDYLGTHTEESVNDFHVCPSSRLTKEYAQQSGMQYVYDMAYLQRQNTSTEEDPNRAVRTVPVVFHIVYRTGTENVSDAVINNLLLRLNQDFRKNNSLIANIRPAFTSVATDAQIEFCLATKDPSGVTLTTPGITRTTTTMTYFNPDATNVSGTVGGANSMKTAQYGKAPWDRSKYVNIWICNITNGANYGTAGYAYLSTPTALPPSNIDGIVLDYNIGVQSGNSRAVSHEMGHYFGLDHTFGDPTGACNTTAASDDGFSDTPRIKNAFQNVYNSCASATTAQSCVSGTLWQYENLMDYSNCFSMFTTQQANYMNSVLSGSRNSLNTSYTTNCAVPAPVAPVANFTGCNSSVGQGTTVTFTDGSTGVPTSWSWSITPATGWSYTGGTSATSQNPQVLFTANGTYSVALTATNAQGSNTKTSASCITVVSVSCNDLTTPLTMGFETSESLTNWLVENTNGDQVSSQDVTWGVVSNTTLASNSIPVTAHGGTQAAYYLYSTTESANDWLFAPCLALQAGTTYSLKFWYRATASQYPEKMRVKIGTGANSASMTLPIVDLGSITTTTWLQSSTPFTVPTTGNYYIGFQAYSDADQYVLFLDDINISKSATAVVAPVANFSGCGSYTTNSTVTLTNTSTNSPTTNAWTITPNTGWSYTGGTSASSTSPQVTFTTAGTYTVSLVATNSAGSNTKTTQNCLVIAAPVALAPVANFTGCTNITTNGTVNFTNTSTNIPTSFAWTITPSTGVTFVNGTSATSPNPQVSFASNGTYTVSLTATNATGSNTKTTQSCVVVTNSVGIEDIDFGSGVSLFPNPSTGLTTLSISHASQYTNLRVNIYNAVGELVFNSKLVNDEVTMDLSAFSTGIYFVEIRSNEAVATKRLIIGK